MAQTPSVAALAPGTPIQAELRGTIESAHARAGMRIEAVVTKDVKQGGETVLRKGSRLLGTVIAVTPAESPKSPSHVTLAFTQVRTRKGEVVPLHLMLTKVEVQSRVAPPPMMAMPPPLRAPGDEGGGQPAGMPPAGAPGMPGAMNAPGEMEMPPVAGRQAAPIYVRPANAGASELTSTGNFKLESGTRLALEVVLGGPGGL